MAAAECSVLLSGGLDSAVLAAVLARDHAHVHPLYVRCGLRWEAAERRAVRAFLEALVEPKIAPLVELDLPVADAYGAHWSLNGRDVPDHRTPDEAVYLPGRNVLLLAKAAVHCRLNGIGRIALGLLKNNPFPDSTPEFFAGYEAVLSQALGGGVEILRPFAKLTKPDVLRLGAGLPLERTLSCMQPELTGAAATSGSTPRGGVARAASQFPAGAAAAGSAGGADGFPLHCGRCNKCAERRRAFLAAGLPDRTAYAAVVPRS